MSEKVKDVMTRNVQTAGSDETILKATQIMNEQEIGCIVVTEYAKAVGVVTERDILKRVVLRRKDPAEVRLFEVMSKPLITVEPDDTVSSAAETMIKKNIKKLVVVNDGNLEGILSLTDLVPLIRRYDLACGLSMKGLPKRVKRVFETYTDPETKQRKKCPLIILAGAPVNCLTSKCMWWSNEHGCARAN